MKLKQKQNVNVKRKKSVDWKKKLKRRGSD